MKRLGCFCSLTNFFILFLFPAVAAAIPPEFFDLRNVDGQSYVTSIKNQKGGTCWTHGAMAAIESNLLISGNWTVSGDSGEPNLAEYHLDWWNGFNQFANDDIVPHDSSGLEVHYGGDYMVASAYFSRGEGAVRDIDGQSYDIPPERYDTSYHYYYPREIQWHILEEDFGNMDLLKNIIMTHGAVGTSMLIDFDYFDNFFNSWYQPPDDATPPNHAVAIVGWSDLRTTQAPLPGAWLIKNSWGGNGYFWISYYDRWCAKRPEMGFVSFQDVERMEYNHVYYHDYHGWRGIRGNCCQIFNAFAAQGGDELGAVSFFTTDDSVDYTIRVYDYFDGEELSGIMSEKSGFAEYKGFHTVDFDEPIELSYRDDSFYVYLDLSNCYQAYDKTSQVSLLLGSSARPTVRSRAAPGQSYFNGVNGWSDLFLSDNSANFCVKGLSNIFVSFDCDTSVGCPPLDVNFEAWSSFDVDQWRWDFGNGDSAFTQKAFCSYKDGGKYDVSLAITADDSIRMISKRECIIVLEDSLFAGCAGGIPGSPVELTICASNAIPLYGLRFPVQYSGPIDLTLDSFSTAGCRTELFDYVRMISYDPINKFAGFSVMHITDSIPDLGAGSGPVLKVYFSIPEESATEDSVIISFDPCAGNSPLFQSERLLYPPLCFCGSIAIDVCGDADGDYTVNILDVTSVINYLYKDGPPPIVMSRADVDGSGMINILDVTYLINYLYKDGPDLDCP